VTTLLGQQGQPTAKAGFVRLAVDRAMHGCEFRAGWFWDVANGGRCRDRVAVCWNLVILNGADSPRHWYSKESFGTTYWTLIGPVFFQVTFSANA
jgi:hypothetical protein